MEYTKWILSIYEDKNKFINDKNKLESYLISLGLEIEKISTLLWNDLYIQFLSVINPFFLDKKYRNIDLVIINLFDNIDLIKNLKNKISPSLVFMPNKNWNIIDVLLIKIFNENLTIKKEEIYLNENLYIKTDLYEYPNSTIFNHKPNWADDLIWANLLELFFIKNNKNTKLARLWFFLWYEIIFISCLQNKKIWRINYSIKETLQKKYINEDFYEILFIYLIKNYKNTYLMSKSEFHNSNFYWNFVKNYDKIAKKYGFDNYKNEFYIK